MKKKVIAKIEELHAELILNKGIVPENWKPYIGIIILLLEIAEIFTPDHIDRLIEEIQTALKKLEENK